MPSSRALVPSFRPVRRALARPLAVAGALALGLAGCGAAGGDAAGEQNPALDAITVTGEYGEKPTIEFEAPFAVEESASEVLVVGDGEEVETGDTVTLDYEVVSGENATELDSSFGAAPVTLSLAEGSAAPGLLDAIVGTTVGSRVLVAVAPEAGAAAAEGGAGAETVVFVLDVAGIVPSQADGESVEVPEGAPQVQTDDDGKVTGVDVAGVEAPAELVVTPVLQGDGPEVEADDTVTIQYTGVLAADGTEFDSSWGRGTPATFPLANLIPGWQQGLEGVAVGSRVILQVPAELGYGEQGSPPSIPANADLVFVVDVLATE